MFIVCFAVVKTSDEVMSYLNVLSILIVFGGTVSAAIITHGLKRIVEILKLFFKAFRTTKYDNMIIVKELVDLSEDINKQKNVADLMEQDIHPYTKDGLRLIYNKFTEEKILKICKTMLVERAQYYELMTEQLGALAKYPPAFGMMGTIIGLIAVLKQMSASNGIDQVGPSMAVALITTLYGIFIANYIIHPICDNLQSRSERDIKVRRIIAEGILLLNQKENPVYVREVLLGYLLPEERAKYEQAYGITHTGNYFEEAA